MKKFLKTFICAVLLFVMTLPLAACSNDDDTQKELNRLKSQLLIQQGELHRLNELSIQQQYEIEELKLRYSELLYATMKSQAEEIATDKVTVAKSGAFIWERQPATSYLINSADTMRSVLDKLDAGFKNGVINEPWFFIADDGTIINKDYFNDTYANFDDKALVVSVFLSPNMSATVTKHCLYKIEDILYTEINYTYGDMCALENVMVITEVDKSYLTDIDSVVLELNK